MQKMEKWIIGIVLGAVPVIACFLAGWWISIPFVPESRIVWFALTGLLLGVLCDAVFLGRWIRRAYSMKIGVWMAVHIFYSIGMLGFFMGVPIFNVILSIPAGVLAGRRLALGAPDPGRVRREARRASVFTTAVLGCVCILSATIALASPYTAYDLQGMMGLSSPVPHLAIIAIIIFGGSFLLVLGWWLTVQSVKLSYGFFAGRDRTGRA